MTRLEMLTEWVRLKHAGQVIKRSGQPYFDHLQSVAEMCSKVIPFGYEIGLCHDIFEKTQTSRGEFHDTLLSFDFRQENAEFILETVIELTDVYIKTAYPNIKKSVRKEMEETRCLSISSNAQTVKYADLIYNVKWMMEYDIKHSENYLIRKQQLLKLMSTGDPDLQIQLITLLSNNLCKLNALKERHPTDS